MGLPVYAKKVTVLLDNDTDMVKIEVEGNPVFEGNTWDLNLGVWINIMQNASVDVEEKEYAYEG